MVRINIMYPNTEGGKFSYKYYLENHVPKVKEHMGEALKRFEVYQGMGSAGGKPAPFKTIVSLWFEDIETFQASFESHGEEIMKDLPNFTNIKPRIQIEKQLLA